MPVHKPITEKGIYFITFTCYKWLPLLEKTKCFDVIYKSFDVLKHRGHDVLAYVLMPNHLHMLLYYHPLTKSLNFEVGEVKRFVAYEIIKRLKVQGEVELLNKLEDAVQPKDKSRGKLHEVWEDSFDSKECRTEKFVMQKLQYIHANPCAGKWKLADDPFHYVHSSASYYISGKIGAYIVRDYQGVLSKLLNEADESSG